MKIRYGVLLVFMVLFVGAAFAADERFDVPLDDSPRLGPENAPVIIIEFLDFQ
jgi:hypothetical protein